MIEVLAMISIFIGVFFFFAGSIGLLRLPDLFCRLHALAKVDNVGLAFIVLGVALLEANPINIVKIVLIWLFIMAASTVSSYLIAGHALRRGKRNE